MKLCLQWEVECKGACLPSGAAGVNGLHHSLLHKGDLPIPRHQDHGVGSEQVGEQLGLECQLLSALDTFLSTLVPMVTCGTLCKGQALYSD